MGNRAPVALARDSDECPSKCAWIVHNWKT
jgi:hypothetical protein